MHVDEKSTEEIEVRVNRIEEFLKNAQQLKRSTSVTHSTVEEKSKPKPKVKRPSSVIIKKKSNLSEF
jgi:hypothetical protein